MVLRSGGRATGALWLPGGDLSALGVSAVCVCAGQRMPLDAEHVSQWMWFDFGCLERAGLTKRAGRSNGWTVTRRPSGRAPLEFRHLLRNGLEHPPELDAVRCRQNIARIAMVDLHPRDTWRLNGNYLIRWRATFKPTSVERCRPKAPVAGRCSCCRP